MIDSIFCPLLKRTIFKIGSADFFQLESYTNREGFKSSDMRFATERLIAVSVSKPNSLLNPSLTEGIMLFFIIIKNSKFKPEEYK